MRSLWKGLTPFAGNLTLKYFLRFGTNAFYQNMLRDAVSELIIHPFLSHHAVSNILLSPAHSHTGGASP